MKSHLHQDLDSPLAFHVDFYTRIDSVGVAVFWSLLAAVDVDINFLAIAVVSTGSLRVLAIVFPSSAFDGDLCVCGDFGVGGLLVPVG